MYRNCVGVDVADDEGGKVAVGLGGCVGGNVTVGEYATSMTFVSVGDGIWVSVALNVAVTTRIWGSGQLH